MIEVPTKNWRPKVISKYIVPTYCNEYIDSILDYRQYGKCLYRTDISWNKGSILDDIIPFDAACYTFELDKDLSFDDLIDEPTKDAVKDIIIKYWDFFVK